MFKMTGISRMPGMLAAASLASMLAAPPLSAVVSSWSPLTSEEYPPLTASNGRLISAMYCGGGYCDNVYLGYENVGVSYGSNSWTSYFSEEGSPNQNYRTCQGNSYMTGISCQGGYCDNISLQCTTITNRSRSTDCYWTAYFSEEAGYNYLRNGYYAVGVRCRGSYCDDKSIYACR